MKKVFIGITVSLKKVQETEGLKSGTK